VKRKVLIEDNAPRPVRKGSTELDVLEWLRVWEAGHDYFDGDRKLGYGGYSYDGRWTNVSDKLIQIYDLKQNSTLLDIGCAKGYLVNDFHNDPRVGEACGVDISAYALIVGVREGMKGNFFCCNTTNLPFKNNSFDFAFCKDTLHNILTEDELIRSIREIGRVSKTSWIRVGAYNNNEQKQILDKWATFATCYFHVDKWLDIFEKAEYEGDYDWFHPTSKIT
jgi:ubiquinone/menaquinone biosynthesis C-methylase UbiE